MRLGSLQKRGFKRNYDEFEKDYIEVVKHHGLVK